MSSIAIAARRIVTGGVDRVVLALVVAMAVLALLDPPQVPDSLDSVGRSLVSMGPFLLAAVALAAYARASGADGLIAKAFSGGLGVMIALAALVGALSPFCSCGVIPLIAALLAMGVPLAPVMAFWLASPLMDPSMFALTVGALGLEFALFKTFAAIAVGLLGGFGVLALTRAGALAMPLRESTAGGCGAGARQRGDVVWRFWREPDRRQRFRANAAESLLFLGKWLTLAFFLESLMVAYIPGELVSATIGGEGLATVALATLVGVPAYLNGYAALPLIGGLIDQGMAPGAGMAFLLAGGVSSIPAAIAVWALARPPVFVAYLSFAFAGAFLMGALFGFLA